ncbi:MAG TPA: FtsX-like permease family protein, partial [Bryobacteraceae bacterium]
YFETMGIPLVRGRDFQDSDGPSSPIVAIVSDTLAAQLWPGQDPIGKRFKGGRSDSTNPWFSIVGVINEMKYRGLPNNPTADPDMFLPFAERARNFALLVRTPLDPASLAPSVRKVLRDADPAAVIFNVSTMEEAVATQTASARFMGWLMGLFAASALLLAAIGIYGVMAYTVSRRTQEIGIRMALGAPRSGVVRAVVSHGMALVALGLALGAAVARSLAQFLGTLLYGVTASDLATFAAAPLILAAAALLACLIPAARATRIDPALALRGE